jgi:hypothetical protein
MLFLPSREMMESAASQHGKPVPKSAETIDYRSYDLYLDDLDSFRDLATVYTGSPGHSRKQTGSTKHHKKKKRKR